MLSKAEKDTILEFRRAEKSGGEEKSKDNEKANIPSNTKDISLKDAERFVRLYIDEKDHRASETLHQKITERADMRADPPQCTSCIYVMEKLKLGYQYLLPSMCVEFYSLSSSEKGFQDCNEVLDVMSVWGPNIRKWLHEGCYKVEPYGAMSLITPCPSHVICAQMHSLVQKQFCKTPEPDYKPKGETMDKCTTCIFVMERIKQGVHDFLPSICSEVFATAADADAAKALGFCNDVLGALGIWGNNVRSWLRNGCYKSETYGAMEKISPCPSHAICQQIVYSSDGEPFCERPEKTDYAG